MFTLGINMKKIFFASLFLVAFLERVVFDLGPNIELVTMAMLLAAAYLGRKQSLVLVLLVMAVSDIILGNAKIFLFTWTGFALPALLAGVGFERSKISRPFLATGMGLGANLFFFLWTNFGVWALDAWGMYSNGLSGLERIWVQRCRQGGSSGRRKRPSSYNRNQSLGRLAP